MRIAFTTIAVPGHLNSTTTLARRLKARGHDVVFIAALDAEPFVRAAQLPFIPSSKKEYPAGSVGKILDQLSKLDGQAAMEFTFRALGDALQSTFKTLPQTLSEARVDAVVLDQFQFGLGLVPMYLGMPYVHYSNAVHIDFSGSAPLCLFDWSHETTPEALARNHEGLRRVQHAFKPVRAVAQSYAEKVGLQIEWTHPFATISKLAWLTQMPREFDFTCSHLPPQFHYTGPAHDGFGRIEPDFPWDR